MPTEFSKKERAQLRTLVGEAWKDEPDQALEDLFEAFGRWADHDLVAFELSDRIHEFHDGVSRELYKRYAGLPAHLAVGTGMPPEHTDRIRVLTITITAPQHGHRIGGRSLNHASACPERTSAARAARRSGACS